MGKTIMSILVGLVLLGGMASAQTVDLPSPGITPGSPFFFLDRFFEDLGTFFTFGEANKACRLIVLAEERLAEAKALADRGDDDAEYATKLYEEKFSEAKERAERSRNADALAQVIEVTTKHFVVLEEIIERVPEQAKDSVRRALESSKQGQVFSLQVLKGENPGRAVDAGLNVIKAHVDRAKANAGRGKADDAEKAVTDSEAVLAVVFDASRGRAALVAKFSEELTGITEDLDEIKNASPNIPDSVKERVNQVKGLVIHAQLTSLRELVREDPEKAVDIFTKAADARLNTAKRGADERDGDDTEQSLAEYEKYAQFGQEMSTMAQGIRAGETTVEDLVKKATSHHLNVLEEIRQKLPVQAQQEFRRALDDAKKLQELRPVVPEKQVPTQPGVQQQVPARLQTQPTPVPGQEVEREEEEIERPELGAPQQIPGGRP